MTFDLFEAGRSIGVAHYERTRSGKEIVYRDRARFVHGGRNYVFRSETRLTPELAPVRYQLRALVDGRQERATLDVRDGRSKMVAVVGGAEQTREAPLAPPNLVLDNLVVHHYEVLVETLQRAGEGAHAFQTFVPQKLLRVPLFAEPAEPAEVTIDGKLVRARIYRARVGGTRLVLTVDAASGALLEVLVPLQELRLTRRAAAAATP